MGGWQQGDEVHPDCWYALIRDGLKPLAKEASGVFGEPVFRYEIKSDADEERAAAPDQPPVPPEPIPSWALGDAPHEDPAVLPLTPSAIPAVHESGGEEGGRAEQDVEPPLERADEARFLRGNLIHTLLQYLPEIAPENREDRARAYVEAHGRALKDAQRAEIVSETLAVMSHEEFAPLFATGSLAEVPVVARLARRGAPELELSGQIDRLVVGDDEILIVDYKTNRPPPETADEVAPLYRRQLAAYRAALRRIYPGKQVRATLLWTAVPHIMELPAKLLDEEAASLGIA